MKTKREPQDRGTGEKKRGKNACLGKGEAETGNRRAARNTGEKKEPALSSWKGDPNRGAMQKRKQAGEGMREGKKIPQGKKHSCEETETANPVRE